MAVHKKAIKQFKDATRILGDPSKLLGLQEAAKKALKRLLGFTTEPKKKKKGASGGS